MGFLALASGWCVLFFSLSRCKLPLYILPALPALALLTGWLIHMLLRNQASGKLTFSCLALPWICLSLAGAAWIWAHLWARQRGLTAEWSWTLPVIALAAAGWAGCFLSRRRQGALVTLSPCHHVTLSPLPTALWVLCGLLAFGMDLDVVHRLVPAFAREKWPLSENPELVKMAHRGGAAVACPATSWGSLNFLCRSDYLDTEQATMPALIQFLRDHPRTFAVLRAEEYRALRDPALSDLQLKVLQDKDKGIVVYVDNPLAQMKKEARENVGLQASAWRR